MISGEPALGLEAPRLRGDLEQRRARASRRCKSGASLIVRTVWMIARPLLLRHPAERRREKEMSASEQRMRSASSCWLISSEKTPTVLFSRTATCWATFRAKLVFPMPGRPARMIRLPRFRPWLMRSKSMKPVGTPVSMLPGALLELLEGLVEDVREGVKPRWIASSPRPRIACSARPSAACASRPPSRQSRMICPRGWDQPPADRALLDDLDVGVDPPDVGQVEVEARSDRRGRRSTRAVPRCSSFAWRVRRSISTCSSCRSIIAW